jgi:hypothetical protein
MSLNGLQDARTGSVVGHRSGKQIGENLAGLLSTLYLNAGRSKLGLARRNAGFGWAKPDIVQATIDEIFPHEIVKTAVASK